MSFRSFSAVIACAVFCWLGWSAYAYFLDTSAPVVDVFGINHLGYYVGDVQCGIGCDKTGTVTLLLDSQPLLQNSKIKRGSRHAFTLPTKTLSNGKHCLQVCFCDGTYNRNTMNVEREFFVDNQPLQAAFVKTGTAYKVFQGKTLHVQFQTNKEIKKAWVSVLSNEYECFPEAKNSLVYECFIPIACEEQPNEYLLAVDLEDKVGNQVHLDNKFQIVMFPFKKESLMVTADKVEHEKTLGRDGKDLETDLELLAKQSPKEKLWKGAFCTPIEIQRVTCEYGTIRTTQHKGRYAHKALDVINLPKSVVWAPQEGVVVLKDRFAPSGNTVVVDHGLGILSLFYHLDSFADIEVGQKVMQGNPIGTIGKTGFATGYHLHWEMRINNVPVDPMQWIKMAF